MTEYISPYDPRITQWNLQDFEWRHIISTGELTAYNASVEFIPEGNRLMDESTVKYRDWTDEELSRIRENEYSKGKSEFDVNRFMLSIGKKTPIIPPNTSIVHFKGHKISYWLSHIVFKIDDVWAFETKRGNLLDGWRRKAVGKVADPVPAPTVPGDKQLTAKQKAALAIKRIPKEEVRKIAAKLWLKDPNITKADMVMHDEINSIPGADKMTEKTLQSWITDLNPNKKPGRRPKKIQ